jgi:hypothetical protein
VKRGALALRITRGLFRLWIVVSALWIIGVGATTNWGWYFSYQPTLAGEQPPGRLQFTATTCTAAKTPEECSAMLEAAGKNPFDAYDLKWTDTGWGFADNTVMVPIGMVWERVWPRAVLAFIPRGCARCRFGLHLGI